MHSQLYISGKVAAAPATCVSKNGKEWIRLLVETRLIREPARGEFQEESVLLPLSCFSQEAVAVKHVQRGDWLVVGCHLYGTKYRSPDGQTTKYGLQLVADVILAGGAMTPKPQRELVR
jgi:hypothetical protein